VKLTTGETIEARSVASNADAHVTFEKLIPAGTLPDSFQNAVSRIDYSSASMKINIAVSELPDFTCMPGKSEPGPQHRGTIHIGATCEEIERAYDDAKYGQPSQRPIIEMTIPTAVDNTLAPPGQHILSLFVQYAPYQLARGNWDEIKDDFADRCIQRIAAFAPNVPASVLHRQVLSPFGSGTYLQPDRRQYFSRCNARTSIVQHASGSRLERLSHADCRVVPVWQCRSSRRRRHGCLRS